MKGCWLWQWAPLPSSQVFVEWAADWEEEGEKKIPSSFSCSEKKMLLQKLEEDEEENMLKLMFFPLSLSLAHNNKKSW